MDHLYIIAAGLLVGIIIAFFVDGVLWVAFVLTFLVVPLLEAMWPNFEQARWATSMFYFWMWMIVGFRVLVGKVRHPIPKLPSIIWFFLVFMFCAALGSVYARNFVEAVAAGRGYFGAWVIAPLLFLIIRRDSTARYAALALVGLALIQPLVAGYQNWAWSGQPYVGDRIGGTFGGRAGSGAVLSIFLMIQLFVIISIIKNENLKVWAGVSIALWIFTPILWTHAKAIVVLLPFGMSILFARELKERPVVGIAGFVVAVISSGMLAYSYFSVIDQYKADPAYVPDTFGEFVDGSLGYAVLDSGREELNRGTALLYWVQTHGFRANPLETLVGHGIGSARKGTHAAGYLYDDPRYGRPQMGYTSMSRLLWEVGIIGTIAYLGIFISAAVNAGRLSRSSVVPRLDRAILGGYQAALVTFVVVFFWKDYVEDVSVTTISAFLIGYVLYWYSVDAVKNKTSISKK